MSAPDQTRTFPRGAAPAFGLILIVAAVIAGLAVADTFLEKTEQAELRDEASQSHSKGLEFLKKGKAAAAVDALRKTHSLDRSNLDYELDLIEALMSDDKASEAQPMMKEVLEEDPNDGRANLIAARLTSNMGKIVDAESYYHRAIYGEWPADAEVHQTAARLELVDFLVKNGKQHELLAELLPLQEEAARDRQLDAKLGHLFLMAGSPSRAAEIFRSLIQRDRNNAAAYAGLGEAELSEGDFHAAHSSFAVASARNPNDPSIHLRLDLSTALTALDPTPRWLSSIDKYRRSLRILQLATEDLNQCVANHPSVATGEGNELLESANEALSQKPAKQITNELSEGLLGIAEKLWQARTKSCGYATTADSEPLRLIMEKLSK